MPSNEYIKETEAHNLEKIRSVIAPLPPYVKDFMRGISVRTTTKTRLAYAYDLSTFFNYLHKNNSVFSKKEISEISLSDLEALRPSDIEEFIEFLTYGDTAGTIDRINTAPTLSRKIASLNSFYRYFYKREMIRYNPIELVNRPKIREHNIIRLDAGEIAQLLENVENGEGLTERQRSYNEKTKARDLAILTLFLGTGIRISELIGLDIQDVDFRDDSITVLRKGEKIQTVYFSDEVEEALLNYMTERELIIPCEGHENALFLSTQKKRISVRAVENLVEKYADTLGLTKHISPHKLRASYGSLLYQETGDLYLTADVLGHRDVNTTRRFYAAQEDARRRSAKDKVRLRNE